MLSVAEHLHLPAGEGSGDGVPESSVVGDLGGVDVFCSPGEAPASRGEPHVDGGGLVQGPVGGGDVYVGVVSSLASSFVVEACWVAEVLVVGLGASCDFAFGGGDDQFEVFSGEFAVGDSAGAGCEVLDVGGSCVPDEHGLSGAGSDVGRFDSGDYRGGDGVNIEFFHEDPGGLLGGDRADEFCPHGVVAGDVVFEVSGGDDVSLCGSVGELQGGLDWFEQVHGLRRVDYHPESLLA